MCLVVIPTEARKHYLVAPKGAEVEFEWRSAGTGLGLVAERRGWMLEVGELVQVER